MFHCGDPQREQLEEEEEEETSEIRGDQLSYFWKQIIFLSL